MWKILSLLFLNVSAAVIGIDLGSELFKTSLIRPGKRLVIVENEQSKRSTPSAISFSGSLREYGYNALREQVKKPDSTVLFSHNLFGVNSQDYFQRAFQPLSLSVNEERNSTNIKILEENLEVEEIMAMILEHVKEMSQKFGETTVKDCAITVPSFWNRAQRIALITTAQSAGLNVLSLINENTAAAFYYGIDRLDNETDHYTIFYNLGSSYLQVSLARYSSANKTSVPPHGKIIENIEILAHAYDDTLGGTTFDSLLALYLAEKFEAEYKHDVKNIPKVMIRLFQQANNAKRVLSASKSTLVIVNNMYKGIDFKYQLSREELENLIKPFESRLISPIYEVLEKAKVGLEKVNFLEIIGGVTRIPKIQEIIKEKTGFDASTHLNGDEAMAHGAALFGANFSSVVQVKPIWLSDLNNFVISAKFLEVPSNNVIHEQIIFDKASKVGTANVVRLKTKSNVKVLLEDLSTSEVKSLGMYEINGVNNITIENYEVAFTFVVDYSDIVFLYSVDAEYEVPVRKPRKPLTPRPKKPLNITKTEEKDPERPEDLPEIVLEAKEEPPKPEELYTLEKRAINLKSNYFDLQQPRILGSADLRKIRSKLLSFKDDEKKAKDLAELKNELESYVYYLVEKAEEEVFMSVTTAEERERLSEQISAVKEWMETSEFETARSFDVKTKKKSLVSLVEDGLIREKELEIREKAVLKAKNELVKFSNDLVVVSETKPWLNQTELQKAWEKVNDTNLWIDTKVKEQSLLQLWEPLAFTSSELESKIKIVESNVERLKRLNKPKKKDPFFPDFMNFGDDFDWEKYKEEYKKKHGRNITDEDPNIENHQNTQESYEEKTGSEETNKGSSEDETKDDL